MSNLHVHISYMMSSRSLPTYLQLNKIEFNSFCFIQIVPNDNNSRPND